MKIKIIFLVILLNGLIHYNVRSQQLTPEQKQQIITNLSSSIPDSVRRAILRVIKYNVTEALPVVEERIWENKGRTKFYFFEALAKLGSSKTDSIGYILIDSAGIYSIPNQDVFPPYFPDSLELRLNITEILFSKGNYSTANYVFEVLGRGKSTASFKAEVLLRDIMLHVPSLADSAKAVYVRIALESPDASDRWYAFNELVSLYGQEQIPLIVDRFLNDPNSTSPWGNLRMRAMDLLFEFNYPGLHDLLINRLRDEPDWINRTFIAESLLYHFGRPADYKLVKDYINAEPDTLAQWSMGYELEKYVPRKLFDSISIYNQLDTVRVCLFQVQTFSWLGGQSFVNELDSNLTAARSYIVSGDSNNCARQIKLFQQKVDEEYRDSLDGDNKFVTVEGWKFLYYNAQYILDRLPVPPPQYNLNINVVGNGTVTKSPELALYDSSATVTLTANPSTGYRFGSWSGDVLGTINPTSVVMNSDKNITGTFEQNIFTITATSGTNGTITPSGDVSVNYGANQLFTITPNTGYHIADVVIDQTSVGAVASYTFTNVTAAHIISATFAINTYTLTVSAINGSIVKNPDQPNYNYNTTVQLNATPNTGYSFVNWTGDLTGAINPTSINMNANKSVTANFAINIYTLTVIAVNGTVTKSPNQPTYTYGITVQLTATPSTGYGFVGWSGDLTGSANPVTITMDANKNITANFTLNPPTISGFTPANGPIGTTVTITGTNFISITSVKFNGTIASYTVNSSSQITATVPTGATTGSITVTNTAGTATSSTTFKVGYILTIQIAGSGTVTKNPNYVSYTPGTTVTLTAKPTLIEALKIVPNTPEPISWKFDHWEIDLTGTQNPKSIIMSGNKTVKAVFVPVY